MRKTLLLLPFSLILASCEVHHSGKWAYDVHWWVIAIPAVVICILAYVISGKIISKDVYVCPKCNHEFYPNRWTCGFSIHESFNGNDERVLRCPKCKRKGFCRKR